MDPAILKDPIVVMVAVLSLFLQMHLIREVRKTRPKRAGKPQLRRPRVVETTVL